MATEIPEDLLYSQEHEWIRLIGEEARIGLTDYAQSELGDIVYVELPEVGQDIEQMEELGVVESVKTVSTVYAPVGGEILAINNRLEKEPDLINDSPYNDGWMVKIAISDMNEVDDLMTPEEYNEFINQDDEEE